MGVQFKVDDVVLYGTEGICRITSIEARAIGDEEREYYILKPVYQAKTTISVPCTNERLVSKMRHALAKEEVLTAINAMPDEDISWIKEENERVAQYKAIIASGDTKKIIQVIKALYHHKKEQEALGKKAHAVDDRLLKSAESLLHDEFAYALGIDTKEVAAYIDSVLSSSKKKK